MSRMRASTQVGAAVFVLGVSLAGPQALGVAAAESPDDSSAVSAPAEPATDHASKATRRTARPATRSTEVPRANRAPATASPNSRATAARLNSPRPTPANVAVPSVGGSATVSTPAVDLPGAATALPTASTSPSVPVAAAVAKPAFPAQPVFFAQPRFFAQPLVRASAVSATALPVGNAVAGAAGNWLSALFSPIQSFVEGIGLLVRRTFFNNPPTVNPIQLTGQTSGPITGTVGAIDPEGDPITYSLRQAPAYGTVQVAADGTYTYTPGTNFTGTDNFLVAAADSGLHINLLNLFRPAATQAFVRVKQGAVQSLLTFDFNYGSGSRYWSSAARGALEATAEMLASYFVVSTPVTLTFAVTATNSAFSSTLASSGSDLIDDGAGFFDTVIQHKILTGVDSNGSAADGTIDWNFGPGWGFGATVPSGQYDFTSTATHELLHTFGFISNVDQSGSNTGRNWLTFDSFITTSNGTPVIGDNSWNTAYNTNLTGGNGGLYFNGAHAVTVYGGPVPLYTPRPWESGSSMSHLDDSKFTGRNEKLMNAQVSMGQGVRNVSPLELAIMQDLGYTINGQPVAALLFVAFGFVRRRRSR